MSKALKIIIVVVVLGILTFLGLKWKKKQDNKTDLYLDLYPFMETWSDTKKEEFKEFSISDYAKWWESEGNDNGRGNGEYIWETKSAKENDKWLAYWKTFALNNKLDNNGF